MHCQRSIILLGALLSANLVLGQPVAEQAGPAPSKLSWTQPASSLPVHQKRRLAQRALEEYTGPLRQPTASLGCDILLDDFNDADAEGWVLSGFTNENFSASVENGRYVMRRTPGGAANPTQYFVSAFAASDQNDALYDGTLSLTFRITESGTTFVASGRGFFAQFVVQFWNGRHYLLINPIEQVFDTYTALDSMPFDLQIGVDYRMEGRFVGPDLSMKVWRAADPEPAEPQLTARSPHWGDPFVRRTWIDVEIDSFWSTNAQGVEIDDVAFCPEAAPAPPEIDPNAIPVSGIPVPGLAVIDDITRRYMALTHTRSFVHSYMVNGKVQFHRAYGWEDEARTQPLQPDAMMRVASISKPFTAAAIRELVADRRLRMSDKAFDLGQPGGGILRITPYPSLGDQRYKDITVQHLLEHTSGWDRGVYGDIFWCDFHAARTLGVPMPISRTNRLRFLLGTPLQYNPGEPGVVDPYSNTAYDVLGLIVERVSGMAFEEYIRRKVLPKIDVARSETEIGRSFPIDFNRREPFYDVATFGPSVFHPPGPWARLPYGGWHQESYAALGGRIASTVALMGLASHRYLSGPDAGRPLPRRLPADFYDFHNGALPGVDANLLHINHNGDDIIACALANRTAFPEYIPFEHPGAAFYFSYILEGQVTWPQRCDGDMNCDSRVDVRDLLPFFLAITDVDAYAAAFPHCTAFNADANGDLLLNYDDLFGFLERLGRGGCN